MTGLNYSNKNQKGQTLLVVIMVLATLLTVVLAISFRSTTETKVSKLEEENQRALAAAEAGIEAALKQGNINQSQFSSLLNVSGFTGSATVASLAKPTFVTPLLNNNQSYTFYLSSPDTSTGRPNFTNWSAPFTNNLLLCYGNHAIELTLIQQNTSNGSSSIKHYAVDPRQRNVLTGTNIDNSNSPSGNCPQSQSDFNFNNSYNLSSGRIASGNNVTRLLVIRIIDSSGPVRIGFWGGGNNLPLQGRTITSQAQSAPQAGSQQGVSKKIELFQSYPQIPSEFLVTRF